MISYIEEFPFLKQGNGNVLTDLPQQWVDKFGYLLCLAIKEALISRDAYDDYEVYQVKEKYGEIRWYDNHPEITEGIIDVFNYIATHTCVGCGKTVYSTMRLYDYLPLCDECKEARKSRI